MRKLDNPIAGGLPGKYFFKILRRFNRQQDIWKFLVNSESDLKFKRMNFFIYRISRAYDQDCLRYFARSLIRG